MNYFPFHSVGLKYKVPNVEQIAGNAILSNNLLKWCSVDRKTVVVKFELDIYF